MLVYLGIDLLSNPQDPKDRCLLRTCEIWFGGCFASQQRASVSLGWICLDHCMCCHTETEDADLTRVSGYVSCNSRISGSSLRYINMLLRCRAANMHQQHKWNICHSEELGLTMMSLQLCWIWDVSEEGYHGNPKHVLVNLYKGSELWFCVVVGWVMSQQCTGVSLGLISPDNWMCCHTEVEVADQTLFLTLSWYTDMGPTIPGADLVTVGFWQGSHWCDSAW